MFVLCLFFFYMYKKTHPSARGAVCPVRVGMRETLPMRGARGSLGEEAVHFLGELPELAFHGVGGGVAGLPLQGYCQLVGR